VTFRDTNDWHLVHRLGPFDFLFGVTLSPNGQFVAVHHGPASIIEIATSRVVQKAPYRASLIAFLRAGIVAVGDVDEGSIRLSRLTDDAEVGRIVLPETAGRLSALAAATDGSRLFVGTTRAVVLVLAAAHDE